MLTAYARYEKTTDLILNHKVLRFDVVIYKDAACFEHFMTFPWNYTESKPTRRNKFVTINCYRYALIWLPAKENK